MNNVKKIVAVIPLAGLATRMLPITKSVPKSLLSLNSRPAIEYIVKEATDCGIKDFIFIVSENNKFIEGYFRSNKKLEDNLLIKKKFNYLEILKEIQNLANIKVIIQEKLNGLGGAIYKAKELANKRDILVLLGDDIFEYKKDLSNNPTNLMLQEYFRTNKNVLLGIEVADEDVSKYGMFDYEDSGNSLSLKKTVEKPNSWDQRTNLASPGRYLFKNEIFDLLEENIKENNFGLELDFTQAINKLAKENKVNIVTQQNLMRYDIGNNLGYMEASLKYSLKNPEYKLYLKKQIKTKPSLRKEIISLFE